MSIKAISAESPRLLHSPLPKQFITIALQYQWLAVEIAGKD